MNDRPHVDIRSLDPIAYIKAIGLRPEDSYGFLPVEQSDGSALVYVYRDRPEYAQRRSGLGPPQKSRLLGGAVEVDRPGDIELDIDPRMAKDVDVGGIIQAALGGAAPGPEAPPPEHASSGPAAGPAEGSGQIVSQRVYPGLRSRSSGKQLNHFLPRYREVVGLRPEDTFGVFAQGIYYSGGESSAREWDSYWLVYRDRPEYAPGREQWAAEMDKRGNWPQPMVTLGVSEATGAPADGGKLEIKKDGWSKRKLVVHETPEGLGESLAATIAKHAYRPEAALGLAPDFQQRKIYFAWRKD